MAALKSRRRESSDRHDRCQIDAEADDVLYEDDFVSLNSETGLHIKWYYFPTAAPKRLARSEIASFNDEPRGLLTSKDWGQGFGGVWYACDMGRQCSDEQRRFLSVTVEGSKLRCGFSVRDGAEFRDAMAKFLSAE